MTVHTVECQDGTSIKKDGNTVRVVPVEGPTQTFTGRGLAHLFGKTTEAFFDQAVREHGGIKRHVSS